MILCETEIFSIDENWLPQRLPQTPESKQQVELPRRLLAQEKDMIEAALKDTCGRVSGPSGAAVKLGIPRSTLESKIRLLKSTRIALGPCQELEGCRLLQIRFVQLFRCPVSRPYPADMHDCRQASMAMKPILFLSGRLQRAVFFRRRSSLSLIISFKSAAGRISIGPSPYLKPGSCEVS